MFWDVTALVIDGAMERFLCYLLGTGFREVCFGRKRCQGMGRIVGIAGVGGVLSEEIPTPFMISLQYLLYFVSHVCNPPA